MTERIMIRDPYYISKITQKIRGVEQKLMKKPYAKRKSLSNTSTRYIGFPKHRVPKVRPRTEARTSVWKVFDPVGGT